MKVAEIFRIERARFADKIPLYHLLNYLPVDVGKRINPKVLKNKTLTAIMEVDLKIPIKRAVQTIEADIVDSYIGPILDAREGDPCLILRRVVYAGDGKAVEYLVSSFRADRYMYTDMLLRQKKGKGFQWQTAEFSNRSRTAKLGKLPCDPVHGAPVAISTRSDSP